MALSLALHLTQPRRKSTVRHASIHAPHGNQSRNFESVLRPSSLAMKYIPTFGDLMCFTTTYLLMAKSDVVEAYRMFEAWVHTQRHCTAFKVLCSDRGGEYLSNAFDKHLAATETAC